MARGFTDEDLPNLSDQRFLITGGNTGLGFETARALARKGAAVVLLCRDQARGDEATGRLRQEIPRADVSLELLDLGSLASIRAFADRELAASRPVTGLVCNAGLMAIPQQKTTDGFERQIGVNHLGHFALVGQLMPRLSSARVVVVSSGLHKRGKLELFDDLFFEKRPYDRWVAYDQSKLANLLFMFELARRAQAHGLATVPVGAHPGYAATELQGRGAQQGSPRWEGWGMALGNRLFAQSGRAGAWPQLFAATDPAARPGNYYGPGGLSELRGPAVLVEPRRTARDEATARSLWTKSEELTGVRFLD